MLFASTTPSLVQGAEIGKMEIDGWMYGLMIGYVLHHILFTPLRQILLLLHIIHFVQ